MLSELSQRKKREQLFTRRLGRDHPKDRARWPDGFMFKQPLDVLEPGDARHLFSRKKFPEQDHEATVGDGELGPEEGASIIFVSAEIDHRRRGRRDEQPAGASNFLDRFARRPAKKLDTENGVEREGQNAEIPKS